MHIYISFNTRRVFTRNVTVSVPIKVVVKIEHCVNGDSDSDTGRVGQEPILPVIINITKGNFDRNSDGHFDLTVSKP